MELDNLKTMWQAHDNKIEQSISLNLHTLSLIQAQKAKSVLTPLIWQRVIEIMFHIATILLLSLFCFYNYDQLPYSISAFMLILFYSLAFSNCLNQLKALITISSKNNIISIQSSLAKIQSHNLYFVRLSVLSIPAMLSFPVVISKTISDLKFNTISNFDIIQQSNYNWWLAQLIAFAVLIPLGIWFYHQVDYKNLHKKWVSVIIEKASGSRVRKAMAYIKELEVLKQGDVQN